MFDGNHGARQVNTASIEPLEAVYYPDCYPHNRDVFAAMCLYFDRINFITPSDSVSSPEGYTDYLRRLPDDGVQIGIMGDSNDDRGKDYTEHIASFIGFVLEIKSLLSEVVLYHPSLHTAVVEEATQKLLSGNLTVDGLLAIYLGATPEQKAYEEFAADHPELIDAILLKVLPTARYLAIEKNWLGVSDEEALPIPDIRPLASSAPDLSAILGVELLSISMPQAIWSDSEAILEIREKFSDELVPFRIMMQRLAGNLRNLVGDDPDYNRIKREARFLIDTQVSPHVHEIQRRIEMEKGKLWRKIFGASIKWLSLGIASFADPSGRMALKAIEEAGKDVAELLGTAHGVTIAGDPGLSVLFKLKAM